MANNQPAIVREVTVSRVANVTSSIVKPTIEGHFELKHPMIQLLHSSGQFTGMSHEDPQQHIHNFLQIVDTFATRRVTKEYMRLTLFPFSLLGNSSNWLLAEPADSITTRDDLATKFLTRFFPPAKTTRLQREIMSFRKKNGENLYQAWERFKGLLRDCPQHHQTNEVLAHTFIESLDDQHKSSLDTAAGGQALDLSYEELFTLLNRFTQSTPDWQDDAASSSVRKAPGIFEVDKFTTLSAQIDAMRNELRKLAASQAPPQVHAVQQAIAFCDVCGEGHNSDECPANPAFIYFVGNAGKGQGNNNQYGNSYNPNWRNHPNLRWSDNSGNQKQNYQSAPTPQAPTNSMEEMMKKMMGDMQKMMIDQRKLIADNQNRDLAVRNFERQMGQIVGAQNTRPPGGLRSDTNVNPKPCNAVTLRNGRELEEVTSKKTGRVEAKKEKITIETSEKEKAVEALMAKQPQAVVAKPPPPFPQRLVRQKEEATYKKFIDLLKQVHMNVPLVDMLQGIPTYAKYIKDIVANKSLFTEYTTVALTEECDSRIQNKLPTKLKDPGSFTIEISIGTQIVARAVNDLGASINLIPSSIFQKLGLGVPRLTTIVLQLADRSLARPEGIIEDVLVQVGSLIIPADFVILDFEPDPEVPFILGRPFLATGRALIDVAAGQLTMRVHDKVEVFNVYQALKMPAIYEELSVITVLNDDTRRPLITSHDPLKRALVGDDIFGDTATFEMVQSLDMASIYIWTGEFEHLDRIMGVTPKLSIEEPPK
ncbi:uncharacterized protein LOC132607949 [Lycium barbarum]|uniref:uncharacterized protein LOC132607949 n=1 Tax=Lycium barbarum TaxID=112863 RepID=UPI00293F690A|nr:uncharacterized protein LOC132607949 [Lycium barbarum]